MKVKVTKAMKAKGIRSAGVRKVRKGRPPMAKNLALITNERISVTEAESKAITEVIQKVGFNSASEFLRYCVTFTLATYEGRKVHKFPSISTLSDSWSWQRASADILRVAHQNKQQKLPLEVVSE